MRTTLDAVLGWIAADRHCGYRDGDVLRGEAAEGAAGTLPWGRQSCLDPHHAPAPTTLAPVAAPAKHQVTPVRYF